MNPVYEGLLLKHLGFQLQALRNVILKMALLVQCIEDIIYISRGVW
jgi:hypothetical protein